MTFTTSMTFMTFATLRALRRRPARGLRLHRTLALAAVLTAPAAALARPLTAQQIVPGLLVPAPGRAVALRGALVLPPAAPGTAVAQERAVQGMGGEGRFVSRMLVGSAGWIAGAYAGAYVSTSVGPFACDDACGEADLGALAVGAAIGGTLGGALAAAAPHFGGGAGSSRGSGAQCSGHSSDSPAAWCSSSPWATTQYC